MSTSKFFKFLAFSAIILSVFAFAAPPTLINLVTRAMPGAVNTILETDASGNVAWTAKNSVFSGDGSTINVAADGTISQATSGVTVGTYGSSANVPRLTVDASGNVTGVVETAITTLGDVTGGILATVVGAIQGVAVSTTAPTAIVRL